MRNVISSSFCLFAGLVLTAGFARADELNAGRMFKSIKEMDQSVQRIQNNCDPNDAACNEQYQQCKETAQEAKSAVQEKTKRALEWYRAESVGCQTAANKLLAGLKEGQEASEQAIAALNDKSTRCQTSIANAMSGPIKAASKCVTEVKDNCGGQKFEYQALEQNCKDVAQAAKLMAVDKSMSAGGMLDNALKATQLGLGLGQLGQMLAGQKGGGSGVSGSPEGPIAPSTVDLGGSDKNAGGIAGFGTKESTVSRSGTGSAGFSTGSDGFAPLSEARDFSAEASPIGGDMGFAAESGISPPSVGGGSGGGFSGSAGGAGGAGNGSGASKLSAEDRKEVAGDIGAFEVGAGGGGRPSFLGLKSGGSEFDELGKDLGLGAGTGLDGNFDFDGDRDLASAEQGAFDGGINEEDGVSIFSVVHSKISEMKKRGSI